MSFLFNMTPFPSPVSTHSSLSISPALPPLSDPDLSDIPDYIDVVCNAPLVAPIPLPYLSPTFLQFHLLPELSPDTDSNSDLPDAFYNPPRLPTKRKRADEEIVSLALLVDSCAFSADYRPTKRLAQFPSRLPSHRVRR